MLDAAQSYQALQAADRTAHDGHFFVAVSSTGIYCRPVCSARLPKPQNLTFFETSAQAEAAGYRPCLKCHPELAPDIAPGQQDAHPAWRAYRLLKQYCSIIQDLDQFLRNRGLDPRQTQAAFQQRFGVTLDQQLLTFRLGLAKQLVSRTQLDFDTVAQAVGLKGTEELALYFANNYRFTLSSMRRPKKAQSTDAITLQLPYRPPYDWQRIVDFLAMRAIPGAELVNQGIYYRAARVPTSKGEAIGWVSVAQAKDKNALAVTVSNSLLPGLSVVLERISRQFDLAADPASISQSLEGFNQLCPGRYTPGTRVPGCFDPYEMSVRAILGQQISVKGASTLAGRVATTAGTPLVSPVEGLTHVFPGPGEILQLEDPQEALGSLGIIGRRVNTIVALAQGLDSGQLDLDYGADPAQVIPALEAMPGIGPWTAQYIAMRTIGYGDGFPSSDLGVKKALAPRTVKEIEALAESWRPWRAYATLSLWSSH